MQCSTRWPNDGNAHWLPAPIPLVSVEQLTPDLRVLTPTCDMVDHDNLEEVRAGCLPSLEEGIRIILDLRYVDFMDSSGIGFLVSAARESEAAGGEFSLSGLTPHVRGAFEILRLDLVIRVFNDCGEALRSLSWAR